MLEDARRISEVVFSKAPYRLEVAAAIYRIGPGPFTTAELQAHCAEPLDRGNNVGRNLKVFKDAGLLTEVSGLWQRYDCPLWRCSDQWLTELVGSSINGIRT
jgi:hypothetical protein